MGKGDKKTKRGKIARGSFGVSRPRKNRQYTKSQEEVKELVNKQANSSKE